VSDTYTNILLIEDNPGDARFIRELLKESRGKLFELKSVETLLAGLECLIAEKFNVILLDLSLPDSFGLDTFIKTYNQVPEVPIIVLTGTDDDSLAMHALQEGAQDYLVKGHVDSELLWRSLGYAIERNKLRLQLKQKMAEIESSEERAKAQYKGIPIPTLTWQKINDKFLLVDYNDAIETITQGTIADCIEMPAEEFFGDQPDILDDLSRCMDEKSPIVRELPYQIRGTGNPGYFSFTYAFVPPNLVMQHAEDIMGKKQAEDALRVEKEFIEILIETANSLIVGLNEQGCIILINRMCETLLGWKREEIIGKNWFDIFIPTSSKNTVLQIFKDTKAGTLTNIINPIKTKQGERLIWWHNTTIKRENEKIFIAIGIDITEEEKSRKRIEDLNKSLRLIIHILGHDVLNDFHAIRLALEIIKQEPDETALEIAFKNIDTSVRLIKKMRELENLITSGEELKPIQVREVVEEIIKTYTLESIDFEVEGDGEVLADAAFSSVIDNLVQNAIIHGKTTRIDIKIEPKAEFCEIRIADYGVGIPNEIKSHLFTEGFKYGPTGRSGLGLYIVKNVIERYGGEIYVEDNIPSGAVFIIKLKRPFNTNNKIR